MFGDRYKYIKFVLVIGVLGFLSLYASKNRIKFSPTIGDCAELSERNLSRTKVAFAGIMEKVGDRHFALVGSENYEADISNLNSIPLGKKISLIGYCPKDRKVIILKYEDRDGLQYLKYFVSLLGLTFSVLLFIKYFRFSHFSFKLR